MNYGIVTIKSRVLNFFNDEKVAADKILPLLQHERMVIWNAKLILY